MCLDTSVDTCAGMSGTMGLQMPAVCVSPPPHTPSARPAHMSARMSAHTSTHTVARANAPDLPGRVQGGVLRRVGGPLDVTGACADMWHYPKKVFKFRRELS